MPRHLRPSIRYRLLAAFAAFLGLLALLSFWIERQARLALEEELGRKLVAIAAAASTSVSSDLVPVLVQFHPGDEESRTYRNIQRRLADLKEATGVERLGIWGPRGRILVDTRGGAPAGASSVGAELYGTHLEAAMAGEASSSILFLGEAGRVHKLGFHPLAARDGRPMAVVVAEGNADVLASAKTARRTLLAVAAAALALGGVIAWGLAASVTRPLERLAGAARRIGRGDLESPVPTLGSDEVGDLSRSLERMRGDLRQRDQQLRGMVAGVAHEIRNPLGGLVLYADLVTSDPSLSAEGREQAGKILREAQILERIVEEFVTFARPVEPALADVDVGRLWDEVRPLVEGRLREKSGRPDPPIRWEHVWEASRLRADARHVRQILLNLALNAAEALGSGGGTVRLRLRRRGGEAVLELEDSGPGVEPARYDEVLRPFATTKPRGAGLGLPMVRRLVEAHGGSVALDRSELGGLAVRVCFPQDMTAAEGGSA